MGCMFKIDMSLAQGSICFFEALVVAALRVLAKGRAPLQEQIPAFSYSWELLKNDKGGRTKSEGNGAVNSLAKDTSVLRAFNVRGHIQCLISFLH